jgi:hypothetical protein
VSRGSPFLPDAEQRLLIDALLLPPEQARPAAERWLASGAIDRANWGTHRLLPHLGERLVELGVVDPNAAVTAAMTRRTWAVNQQQTRDLTAMLDRFAAAGISVALLKGLALRETVYARAVQRPADDIDLLVRHDDVARATAILVDLGWVRESGSFHSRTFLGGRRPDVDLHVSPYAEAFSEALVAPLWPRMRTIEIAGRSVQILSREDQLLHTISHGCRVNLVAPDRWVIDAVLQLRHDAVPIDWEAFIAEAVRLDLAEIAARGLTIVQPYAPERIPADVVPRLRKGATFRSKLDIWLERERATRLTTWLLTRRNARGLARWRLIRQFYVENWNVTTTLGVVRVALTKVVRP